MERHGYMSKRRNTPQRKIIESFLEKADYPLLPKELHERALKNAPNLGIATVFRALKDLVNEHRVRIVNIPGDPPRYEITERAHHHHFKCNLCDQVYDIEGCPGNLERLLPKGFKLSDHDITLFGLCSNCNESNPKVIL